MAEFEKIIDDTIIRQISNYSLLTPFDQNMNLDDARE